MTAPKRLDKSRSVGQISPPMQHPTIEGVVAHYEQNGLFFDHEGKLCPAFNAEQEAKLEALEAGKEAAPAAKTKEAGAKKTRTEKRAEAPKQRAAGSDDLNLDAWLRGEQQYPEFRVKKVVRDRFKRQFGNMRDLVEFLVRDENLVAIDAISEANRKLIAPTEATE